jgi:Flp pilus assembly protein CpaB
VGESSLNPSLFRRISTSLRPDWTRTVLARRVAAGGLVVLAGVATLRSNPDGDDAGVVVAARDLRPGAALTADDVRLEKRSATTIPDGSQADVAAVVGSTLASPTRRGEVLTDVRLLGSRLAESTAGPGARIVPLHLADSALIDLFRVGDVVDVLAAPATDSPATGTPAVTKVVATDAIVVLVSAKQKVQSADSDRVVLVALPARVANTVAGSALGQTVTLTLH